MDAENEVADHMCACHVLGPIETVISEHFKLELQVDRNKYSAYI